jgi:hypothetical protein
VGGWRVGVGGNYLRNRKAFKRFHTNLANS